MYSQHLRPEIKEEIRRTNEEAGKKALEKYQELTGNTIDGINVEELGRGVMHSKPSDEALVIGIERDAYTSMHLWEIERGLRNGLSRQQIELYASPGISGSEAKEIREEVEHIVRTTKAQIYTVQDMIQSGELSGDPQMVAATLTMLGINMETIFGEQTQEDGSQTYENDGIERE